MTRVFDCREEGVSCDLPEKISLSLDLAVEKWNDAYGTGLDGEVISEMLLLEMNNVLKCNIGISGVSKNKKGLKIALLHDCPYDEKTIQDTAWSTVEKIEEEITKIKDYTFLFIEDEKMKLPDEYAEIADLAENCVLLIDDEYIVSPTRQCLNELRSVFASKGIGLHTQEMWKEAKDWGEKITMEEDILGSYIYYKIPNTKPIATSICFDLFDSGVIDGHEFSSFQIPGDLRKQARGKFYTAEEFTNWYLGQDEMNLNRSAGTCDALTKSLKAGGLIPENWVWFADNKEKLIIFDPDKGKEILEEVGFKVVTKPYKTKKKTKTAFGEVLGIKCDLREHQIDPVCAWKKRVHEVKSDLAHRQTRPLEKRIPILCNSFDICHKPSKSERLIFLREGKEALERITKHRVELVLESSRGPDIAGGYIKSPTASGKTFMGMVIIGTLGEVKVVERPVKLPAKTPSKAKPVKKMEAPRPIKKLPKEKIMKLVREMRKEKKGYKEIEDHFQKEGYSYVKRKFIYRATKD